MKRWILAVLASVGAALVLCSGRAERLYTGEADAWRPLADAVAARALQGASASVDSPGGARFDGEWGLVTCQMTVLGLAQVAAAHPPLAQRYRPAAEACLAWLLRPEARAFGTAAWGEDGLAASGAGHAYLGYLGMALGAHRLVFGVSDRYTVIHDQVSARLAEGLAAPPRRFLTYPGEAYPPDQAVAAAAVGLHARASGVDRAALLAGWEDRFRQAAVDPRSGMLFQALDPASGRPADDPRGSGTALAAYALAFAAPDLARDLYAALPQRSFLGFGAVREYPPGGWGAGDIDSGPVLLGVSVAATGFALAGARLQGDAAGYQRLARTATLFGLPAPRHGGTWHLTGGDLGNALLLALLTAGPLR